jgi:cadmium resistance protein CadD (predicted permease)
VFAVAAVTVANGGDNLALYIPVFASSLQAIPIYVRTFAVMTGAGAPLVTSS